MVSLLLMVLRFRTSDEQDRRQAAKNGRFSGLAANQKRAQVTSPDRTIRLESILAICHHNDCAPRRLHSQIGGSRNPLVDNPRKFLIALKPQR